MPLKVGVGSSINLTPDVAIKESLAQAEINIDNKSPQLIILLVSAGSYDYLRLLKEIHIRHSQIPVIGCSTSGHITSSGIFEEGITLIAFSSEQHTFIPFMQPDISVDSLSAGKQCGQQLMATSLPISLVMMFSSGLVGNQQQLLEGLTQTLPTNTPVFGSVAADNFQYQQTFQFYNSQIYNKAIVGVGISGPLKLTAGNTHGWIPIGTPRSITQANLEKISTLSSQPAISIYQQLFETQKLQSALSGNLAKFTSNYPLGMYSETLQDYLIRIPLMVNAQGELICDAHFPDTGEVSIMISSPEEAFEAYKRMLSQIAEQFLSTKRPTLSFMFNSAARKKLLASRKDQEVDNFIKLFSAGTTLVGLYTYGEFFTPLDGLTPAFFQNQSVSLLMVS